MKTVSHNFNNDRTSIALLRAAILAMIVTVSVTGCSGQQYVDLETFIEQTKLQKKGKIDELPQIKHYAPFSYSAFDLRDPFQPYVEEEYADSQKDSGLRPNTDRKADPLESFPLDTLTFVGHIEKRGVRWGLVSAPDKSVYKIQIGNYMGKNFGEIIQISETKILLREIIPDGTGGWIDREASLALSE